MKELSLFEKIVATFIGLLLIFLITSSYGVQLIPGQNFLVAASHAAAGFWKVIGTLFLFADAFVLYKLNKDDWEYNFGTVFLLFLLLALAVSANIGFNYAYDIQL